MGYGYGPGIGEGYDRLVLIISRASGFPVIANAMSYAGQLVKGNIKEVSKKEFEKANKAGLKAILEKLLQLELKKQNQKKMLNVQQKSKLLLQLVVLIFLNLKMLRLLYGK